MSESIIPASIVLAAKRGFLRTSTQAYATALAGGITTTVVLGVVTGEVALVPTLITAAVTLVSPLFAGTASYLSIISNGIPKDYADVTLVKQATIEPVEALANTDAAVTRVLLRRDLKGE